MLLKWLTALGAFVVALGVIAAWIFADFGATRRKAAAAPGSAERLARLFLTRLAVLLGLVSGTGTALLLAMLMDPAPAVWILALIGVGDATITAVALWIVIGSWSRFTGNDPLAELRAPGAPSEPAADNSLELPSE